MFQGPVVGADGLARCPWAEGSDMMRAYHDEEWGRPVHGEQALFERLTLEGFQAGLSWAVVLAKRPAFQRAFLDFDVDAVAEMTSAQLDALVEDPEIIRNRGKIYATRGNARAIISLREGTGLDELIWSHQPARSPRPETVDQVPTRTDESGALALALKRHGVSFIGPTSACALSEAIGMVDAHLLGCHRRSPE